MEVTAAVAADDVGYTDTLRLAVMTASVRATALCDSLGFGPAEPVLLFVIDGDDRSSASGIQRTPT